MDTNTIELVLRISLFLCLLAGFSGLAKYVKDYRVIQLFLAKAKGDMFEYDRVRRIQMKKDIESHRGVLNASEKDKKIPFVSRLYNRMEMTGIPSKIPGFSEALCIIALLFVGTVVSIALSVFASEITAVIFLAAYVVLLWYGMGVIIYNRRMNVESQLLQFTNSAASASRQYANIVDIIGAVYDQFENPFREALEACYVEAKTTNNSGLAFQHLKQKFDSVQLNSVLDNLVMCSTSTGDYYAVATDLSKTVAIYSTSHEKMATTLRNAKLNITVMFVIAIVIMYSLGSFFESGIDVILGTPIGNILLMILVLIYILGISIRAD